MRAAAAADAAATRAALDGTPGTPLLGEWPAAARVWLHHAGLGREEIGRLGATYDPRSQRVYLPVVEEGRLVFWQARALDGRQPKYLAPPVDKTAVLPRWGRAEEVTLTEDILSAFKVG